MGRAGIFTAAGAVLVAMFACGGDEGTGGSSSGNACGAEGVRADRWR